MGLGGEGCLWVYGVAGLGEKRRKQFGNKKGQGLHLLPRAEITAQSTWPVWQRELSRWICDTDN